MSEDHKPTDELEQERILKAGGKVQWKRVDGESNYYQQKECYYQYIECKGVKGLISFFD